MIILRVVLSEKRATDIINTDHKCVCEYVRERLETMPQYYKYFEDYGEYYDLRYKKPVLSDIDIITRRKMWWFKDIALMEIFNNNDLMNYLIYGEEIYEKPKL